MDYVTIYAVDFWALSKATTSSDEDDYHVDLIEVMQDDEENYLRLDSDRIGENIVIELFKMADEFADIQDKIENSIKEDYYSYGRLDDVKQTYEKISKFDVDEFIKLLSEKYPSEVTEDVKSSLKWIDRIFQKAIAEDKEIAIVQS